MVILAMLLAKECGQKYVLKNFVGKGKNKLIYDMLCVYQENYDDVMRL